MGDAFYRWDGFKYYATFPEFIPSVALMATLWSFIALLASIIVWMLLNLISWCCSYVKLRIRNAHILVYSGIFILFGAVLWICKKFMWSQVQTSLEGKLAALMSVALLSLFLTWLFRNKIDSVTEAVFERITPMVWLFGIIAGLSLPLVFFYALWEPGDKTAVAFESSAPDRDRPNILLVTYDALTSRDMSVHGYHRDTTPFITEWAKSATLFNQCEAAANTTSQTVASLMTGKRVWSHRRYQSDAGAPEKIDIESLPLMLKENGYYNIAYIANDIASVKKLGMTESFHVKPSYSKTLAPASFYGFLRKYLYKYFGAKIKLHDWITKEDFILALALPPDVIKFPYKSEYPVEQVFNLFLDELRGGTQQPYFAWLHVYPPHAPYLPPEPYMGMYDPSPKFRTAASQYPLINPRHYTKAQQPDADIVRARYDEFIRYSDEQFKYLIEKLEADNRLENTVIILSSDHGESFSHGYFTHGSHVMFEEMTHIPLIIKGADQKEGIIVDFPVEQTDIPATILDLAGIPVPPWMEGRSLAPLVKGEELQPIPVYSMNMETAYVVGQTEISQGVFVIWEGDYKLIHYITSKKSSLFNLRLDPNEQNNIFASEPVIGRHLLGLLQDKLAQVNESFEIDK